MTDSEFGGILVDLDGTVQRLPYPKSAPGTKSDSAITIGSVVQLRSGGPKLTVTRVQNISHGTWVSVAWFDGAVRQEAGFPVAAVVAVS